GRGEGSAAAIEGGPSGSAGAPVRHLPIGTRHRGTPRQPVRPTHRGADHPVPTAPFHKGWLASWPHEPSLPEFGFPGFAKPVSGTPTRSLEGPPKAVPDPWDVIRTEIRHPSADSSRKSFHHTPPRAKRKIRPSKLDPGPLPPTRRQGTGCSLNTIADQRVPKHAADPYVRWQDTTNPNPVRAAQWITLLGGCPAPTSDHFRAAWTAPVGPQFRDLPEHRRAMVARLSPILLEHRRAMDGGRPTPSWLPVVESKSSNGPGRPGVYSRHPLAAVGVWVAEARPRLLAGQPVSRFFVGRVFLPLGPSGEQRPIPYGPAWAEQTYYRSRLPRESPKGLPGPRQLKD
ncbi:uncharacterized protein LOC112451864, partial [Temnothorax curvispinosus]|uniref:Uncharacterized protein LOC112451864 n=1 Tax=Temnothorax curvispinosus TaxID=300111 RepID=A0A6J1PDL2_9HYME